MAGGATPARVGRALVDVVLTNPKPVHTHTGVVPYAVQAGASVLAWVCRNFQMLLIIIIDSRGVGAHIQVTLVSFLIPVTDLQQNILQVSVPEERQELWSCYFVFGVKIC